MTTVGGCLALAMSAMWTEVLSSAMWACQKQMTQGSAARPSYEIQQSFAPLEYYTVTENAVGTLALALTVNDKEEKASKLRLLFGGTATGVGESHFCFRQIAAGGRVVKTHSARVALWTPGAAKVSVQIWRRRGGV